MNRKLGLGVLLVLFFAFFPRTVEAGPISFRLYSGVNYLQGGDLNDGLQGWANYWIAAYNVYGHPYQTGSFKAVHLGVNFGGDVVLHITPRIGIALGTEYLMAKRTSTLTFQPDMTWDYFGRPSAVPAKLSLYYFTPPAGTRFMVVFHAGLGYYWAKARLESHTKSASPIDYIIDSSASGIGFHGGFGIEWSLSAKLSLFIEGTGRYASISGFEGTTTVTDSSGSGSWKGKLYYFGSSASVLAKFNYIDLLTAAPSGPGFSFTREAKVDFSGYGLRVGVVVKL
jgi:hypothetical protein